MNKDLAEYLINYSLDTGADFSEIFYEDTNTIYVVLRDSKIDSAGINYLEGVGIRLALKDNILYAHTNIIDKENLIKIISELKENFKSKSKLSDVKLSSCSHEENFSDISDNKKKEYLYNIDKEARSLDSRVSEVIATLVETRQKVKIASSKGKFVEDERNSLKLFFAVVVKEGEKTESSTYHYSSTQGYSNFNEININEVVKNTVYSALSKLDAVYIKGGKMPVILASGSGAVIFHEACGHAMEATGVSKGLSVLTNKLNKKIASSKVTIIDDGTLNNLNGTTYYDDEGNRTQKNILIQDGVLKGYLVDEINDRKMKFGITGSGRRESYKFAPTSRMNNTYLAAGNDKIEDMLKDIKYGLYAKEMGGGSVNPTTGDFNFSVKEGNIIRNGKICEPVKMASLIGNTLEILNNVDMVSDDLAFDIGTCGSESGGVPVTLGEPTIRVSSILVGGASND